MRVSILFASLFAVAFFQFAFAQTPKKERALPRAPASPAPAASTEQIAALAEKESYKFACDLSGIAIDSSQPDLSNPRSLDRYHGVSLKGIEYYVGFAAPEKSQNESDRTIRKYCKIRVTDANENTAKVQITVGLSSDPMRLGKISTWNEQIWSTEQDIRLREITTINLSAGEANSRNVSLRLKVARFDGTMD